jgi:guanylate kinase
MALTQEQFIAEVAELYDDYTPNAAATDQLHRIDLTAVCGPTGSGKNTVISATGLAKVVAETIREPRMNDGVMEQNGREYYFRGHELDVVLDQVKRGEHVQIGMGPGRDRFYGSQINNYPSSGPALMDLMTSQLAAMRTLPFASIGAAYVIPPSYQVWMNRLTARGALAADDWAKRRAEAETSLTDSLEDDRFVHILNDDAELAAQSLRQFAINREYSPTSATRARNAARSILLELVDA